MEPGAVLTPAVELTVAVEGSVDSFDKTAYAARLAMLLDVNIREINVRVEAASVRVTATIVTAHATAAHQIISRIATFASDVTVASEALGMRVAQVEPPTILFVARPAPDPPPHPAPQPPTPASPPELSSVGSTGTALANAGASGGGIGLVILIAAGLIILSALVLTCYCCHRRAKRTTASADKSTAFLTRGEAGINRLGSADDTIARAIRPWEQATSAHFPPFGYHTEEEQPSGQLQHNEPNSGALNRAQAAMRV